MLRAVPPPVALLLNETRPSKGKHRQLRAVLRDRRFQNDLRQQVEAMAEPDSYDSVATPRLSVELNVFSQGAANPLSPEAKCQDPSCRIDYAKTFARSTCLYADRVVLTDEVTSLLFYSLNNADPTEGFLIDALETQLQIVRELAPLIDAGVLKFSSPFYGMCSDCKERHDAEVARITMTLWDQFLETVELTGAGMWKGTPMLMIRSPLLFAEGGAVGQQLTVPRHVVDIVKKLRPNSTKLGRLIQEHAPDFQKRLEHDVVSTLLDFRRSSRHRATFATNYRLSVATLRELDGAPIPAAWPEEWELLRRVQLPWISDASPADIVGLREKAAAALPAFRAKLVSELSSIDGHHATLARVVNGLRLEAIELEAKLRAVELTRPARTAKLLAGLGLSIGVYGLASGSPGVATAALGVFSALVNEATKRSAEARACHQELTSKPAYFLLAAQQLHNH
jgi:hypothetical protein